MECTLGQSTRGDREHWGLCWQTIAPAINEYFFVLLPLVFRLYVGRQLQAQGQDNADMGRGYSYGEAGRG